MANATQQQLKDANRKVKTNGQTIFPEFSAKLGTDVTLVGFDMTKQMAMGQNTAGQFLPNNAGYFFALQERPGQLRFGADENEPLEYLSWDNLHWGQMGSDTLLNTERSIVTPALFNDAHWGASSADMANILNQLPVLYFIHSKDMIL